MPDDSKTVALSRLRWLEDKFREFHTNRANYDLQIKRQWKPKLPDFLAKWHPDGNNQSPNLEWISNENTKIRMLIPSKVDVVALESLPALNGGITRVDRVTANGPIETGIGEGDLLHDLFEPVPAFGNGGDNVILEDVVRHILRI